MQHKSHVTRHTSHVTTQLLSQTGAVLGKRVISAETHGCRSVSRVAAGNARVRRDAPDILAAAAALLLAVEWGWMVEGGDGGSDRERVEEAARERLRERAVGGC